ncbi:MAG TPA: endonuclease/exonuclease/phosphatase family protein [Phycisphaerales bacterium]|nr:endonuclease/exonuclease/phosphatase family protein [Phycisphaerales bacterium]
MSVPALVSTPTPPPRPSRRPILPRTLLRPSTTALALGYLALLFAYLIPAGPGAPPSLDPAIWVAFMIRTFLFQAGLGLLALALLAILLRARRLLLFTLPALVFTLAPAAAAYLPKRPPAPAGESLRLLSINLLYLNPDPAAALAHLRAADPDVIAFQEYTPAWSRALLEELSAEYPYRLEAPRTDPMGQAIFSKRALLTGPSGGAPALDPEPELGPMPQLTAHLLLDGRPIAIRCLHLSTPDRPADLAAQRRQIAALARHVPRRAAPLVLAGDFNSTTRTPQHAWLRATGLREAHAAAGRGLGHTWCRVTRLRHLPGIRIDHVYFSPELTCTLARAGPDTGSDHRPVLAVLARRP